MGLLALVLILIGSVSTIAYCAQKDLECFMESGNMVISQQNYDCYISPKTGLLQLFLIRPDGSRVLVCDSLGIIKLFVMIGGKEQEIFIDDKWETQRLILKKQSPEEIITQQIKNYKDEEKKLAFSLITEAHFYKDQPYFDFNATLTNSNKENSVTFYYICLGATPSGKTNRVTIMDNKAGKIESESFTPESQPRFHGALMTEPSSFIYLCDSEKWKVEFSSLDRYPLSYAFISCANYYIYHLYYTTSCFNVEKKRNGSFTLLPEESVSFRVRVTPAVLSAK